MTHPTDPQIRFTITISIATVEKYFMLLFFLIKLTNSTHVSQLDKLQHFTELKKEGTHW